MLLSDWGHDYQSQVGAQRLDPAKMGSILRRADAGDTEAQYQMFSAIEEDPHVHACLSKRKLAVTSRTLLITPSVDATADGAADDAGRERAVIAADLCNALVFGENGKPGIDNWQQAMLDIADGIGRGFSLNQIVWERDTKRDLHIPVALQYWPQSSAFLGPYMPDEALPADHIRLNPDSIGTHPEDLQYGQWIKHVHKVRSDIIARSALLRIVAWWFLFKRFSARDWTIFVERYGMPLRLGKYGRGAQDEERNALLNAVVSLGKDGGAILPDDTSIEFVEAKLQGQIPHEPLARFCDEQISKAILGGSLSTDAGSRGARSLGETQRKDQVIFAEDDSMRIAESIRRDLLAPIVFFNLGADYPVPRCSLPTEEYSDPTELAKRDQILATMGLPLGLNYLYEAHEIPPPDEDEETVGGKKAAPAEPTDDELQQAIDQTDDTTPNGRAQRELLVRALASSGVKKKCLEWVTPTV